MNNLKSIISAVLISVTTLVSAQETTTKQAPFDKGDYIGFLPVLQPGYKPQVSVAPQVAYMSFDDINSSGIAYGAEVAFMCPILTPKRNYIRQQLSFLSYSKDDFKHWNITSNIEYRLIAKPTFELGLGPALGFARNEIKNLNATNAFTYGGSTSATFHFDKMFIALSGRYMAMPKQKFANIEHNLNSVQGVLKLGYKF